jgi:uncharacterized protein YdeI (YjbR/CyaY-like superfamily)
MAHSTGGPEIPMGLGMALAQNPNAMRYFSALPAGERQRIIDRAHGIESKEEMRSFVASLARGE